MNREFDASAPNTVWAGDITYIATQKGWLYLAIFIDLFSHRVVGWAFSASPNTSLVIRALRLTLQTRPKPGSLLFHSGQGCQYTRTDFVQFLQQEGIIQSMSRRGNCWDNAANERFFRSLKTERTRYISYASHAEARSDLMDYMAVFYNHQRLHSWTDNLPPAEYEANIEKCA